MKEKEAAAHLALVEEKAKRVDELEKKMVLLNMDKDKLKLEVNRLSDQMSSGQPGGGSVAKAAFGGMNMLTATTRQMGGAIGGLGNKANIRFSAPLGALGGIQRSGTIHMSK